MLVPRLRTLLFCPISIARNFHSIVPITIPSRISTLDSQKLKPTDFINLSLGQNFVSGPTKKPEMLAALPYDGTSPTFPPHAQGSFYLHKPSFLPWYSWTLRFRCRSSPSPASFDEGNDLLVERTQLPWSQSLIHLVYSRHCGGFLNALLKDKILSPEHVYWIRFGTNPIRRQPIRWLGDPFHLDFGQSTETIPFIAGAKLRAISLNNLFDEKGDGKPLKGSGLFQFEYLEQMSKVLGTRIIALKCLNILQHPEDEAHESLPVESQYVFRSGRMLQFEPDVKWTHSSLKALLDDPDLPVLTPAGLKPSTALHPLDPRAVREEPLLIETLHPAKIQLSDLLDLSGKTPSVVIHLGPRKYNIRLVYLKTYESAPWPPNTRGYLYLNSDPLLPRSQDSLRFRKVSATDDLFENGSDLILPTTYLPWEIPIISVANYPPYRGFCSLLTKEGLLSPKELNFYKASMEGHMADDLIHWIGQVFYVDFDAEFHSFRVYHEGHTHRIRLTRLFKQQGHVGNLQGSALVRFEFSNRNAHRGRKLLLLRIVKILKPPTIPNQWEDDTVVRLTGRALPQNGMLYRRHGELWIADFGSMTRRGKHRHTEIIATLAPLKLLIDDQSLPRITTSGFVPGSTEPTVQEGEEQKTEAQRRRRSKKTIITTLDHAILDPKGFLNVSGRPHFDVVCQGEVTRLFYSFDGATRIPWPEGSQGWLYYHGEPGIPPTTSGIRFRKVQDPETSFYDGEDLLNRTGLPWQLPISSIAHYPSYRGLRDTILTEKFVTEPLLRLVSQFSVRGRANGTELHWLGQLFSVDFEAHALLFHIFHAGNKYTVKFNRPFQLRNHLKEIIVPRGLAVVRFEIMDTNPLAIVLRVIKIVEPITFDETIPREHYPEEIPQEGQLFQRRGELWVINPLEENSPFASLRYLIDNKILPIMTTSGLNYRDAMKAIEMIEWNNMYFQRLARTNTPVYSY